MTQNSCEKSVTVVNPQGLHARPADMLVKTANQFESDIIIEKDGEQVDGKSILSLLTLAAVQGTELSIRAVGHDAQAALDAVAELFARGFGEGETAGQATD